MGKSEVVPIVIHRQFTADEFPKSVEDTSGTVPEGMEEYRHQVAGHTSNGRSIGLMKHQGNILKSVALPPCGPRELQFYENLMNNEEMAELRDLVPKYHGKVTVPIDGKIVDCIVLEDLVREYEEPCIMDIKIGTRTWDPEANYRKIFKEETKYDDLKRKLGFCIPGFQVYKISNNELCRYDKNYCRQLSKEAIPDILKTFLNNEPRLCRNLLIQFLAKLRKIQLWMRKQCHFRFYSSSILLVYDAAKLRESLEIDVVPTLRLYRAKSFCRPPSLTILDDHDIWRGFVSLLHGQEPPQSKIKINSTNNSDYQGENSGTAVKRRNSISRNNRNKAQDYELSFDDFDNLEETSGSWVDVRMIDFAHTFSATSQEIDRNYLEGINNLIRMFEDLLVHSIKSI